MFLALTRQFNYITTSAFYYTPITTSLGNQLIPWGQGWRHGESSHLPLKSVARVRALASTSYGPLSSRRVSCTLTCDQVSFFPFCFGDEGKSTFTLRVVCL